MSYSPYYTGGWQTGETGGTPITPAALNHMDSGIGANAAAAAEQAEDISDVNALLGNTSMGTTATTVTGAIKEHSNKIGNTSMGTTAQTLTGAIAEHESDISALNGKTSGSGTATNTYGSCSYSWVRRANIATVQVEYTPNQAISGSSGSFTLTNIPEPSLGNAFNATHDTNSSTTVCGAAELTTAKTCWFFGPRTSGHVYKTSFTYVVN